MCLPMHNEHCRSFLHRFISECFTGWWFQPNGKILVKMIQNRNLPQIGVKIKHGWNHHLDNVLFLISEPSLSACWTNRWPQEVIDPFLIKAAPNFSSKLPGSSVKIKFSYPLKKVGKEMRKEGARHGKIFWFPKTKVTLDDFQPREPLKTLNMQHPASMHCNLLKGNGCPDLHASFLGGWFESATVETRQVNNGER